ncbi:hypothetical protein [secondary endosymbiont of Ctenarytaina eucalypti]|uniref:Uncharacterized protein n=1 Tax=secondary endosymbiont of Ctenarytaina eucalypti TaxID=1199245 RepID=J3TX25_9ENTR|nr:hypothetical protein [secondary endosymbiont of Ctenarytaina eucalypti]AFP84630.1 hypothetical protein A359_02290 [secondary endosymbiont of Ctenarytaina eucalypti]
MMSITIDHANDTMLYLNIHYQSRFLNLLKFSAVVLKKAECHAQFSYEKISSPGYAES